MTDSMQLPLLDPSLRAKNGLVVWEPSRDAQKSRKLSEDVNGSLVRDAPRSSSRGVVPFARFCGNAFLFAANSFLVQSVAFLGRSRFWAARQSLLDRLIGSMNLDAAAAAAAREAAFVAAWTAAVLAEFYLVWSASRGARAAPRRRRRTSGERRGETAEGAVREEDGESRPDDEGRPDDEAADRLDGAFVIGSTLGCAAYVAAAHGWWAAAGELPPVKAWAYGVWAAVLAAALAMGCVPLLLGGRRRAMGPQAAAKAGAHQEISLEECQSNFGLVAPP